MTSLAGAVQTVESEELLESLGVHEVAAITSPLIGRGEVCDRTRRQAVPVSFPEPGPVYLLAKRLTDIVGSLVGLLLLSPLIAVVAIIIKLSDGGPVFYPHVRVGKWGREFRCQKFRTMVVDADKIKADLAHLNAHEDHRTFKVPDDPRVTRIGRLLRRTSLDEIPQLWNVLRGEMSLVGPRPPVPGEVERYDLDDMQRLLVKPGMTCIWQVSGRSRLPFPKQLELDLAYIEQRSYWLDLKIMIRTLPAVLSADGAY